MIRFLARGRYGFSSESAGSVTVRCHCIVQGPKPVVQTKEKNSKTSEKLKAAATSAATGAKFEGSGSAGLRSRGHSSKEK